MADHWEHGRAASVVARAVSSLPADAAFAAADVHSERGSQFISERLKFLT